MTPKSSRDAPHRLSGVGKWITVSLTTVAALIGLVVNARNLGLTPWLRGVGVSFADLAAQRVLLAPAVDTLRAVGDTLHLAASVTDQHGALLSGATILWMTDDSTIATVDSAGDVIARGAGSTQVSAAVREHRAAMRLVVRQSVRAVAIGHDSIYRFTEGAQQPLDARALDARGHIVTGRGAVWASADTAVLAIDAKGIAHATGPGRTTVTATIDGFSASLPAEVSLMASSFKTLGATDLRAPAGTRMQEPIQVMVYSRSGRPVSDVRVTFVAAADEGSAEPDRTVTDKSGRARAFWTLGTHAGRQRLTITIAGIDSVLSIVAEADPVAKLTRIAQVAPPPSAPAGSKLPDAVGVRVTDAAGAAMADVPVTWAAMDGGTIVARSQRTDSLGEAWAAWTLGPKAGAQHARAQVGNAKSLPPFEVTANALADQAASIIVVSGGAQKGGAGLPLDDAIVVRVADRVGNAVKNAIVSARVSDGSVEDSAPASDAGGRAKIRWTLGHKAGTQTLELAVGSHKSVRVSARALARAPANIAFGALPDNGRAGHALPKSVTITVTDIYGNAVPEAPVTFSVSSGAIAPARVVTDSSGRASTKWTLGATPGDQMLTVRVRGTSVKTGAMVHATKTGD